MVNEVKLIIIVLQHSSCSTTHPYIQPMRKQKTHNNAMIPDVKLNIEILIKITSQQIKI